MTEAGKGHGNPGKRALSRRVGMRVGMEVPGQQDRKAGGREEQA